MRLKRVTLQLIMMCVVHACNTQKLQHKLDTFVTHFTPVKEAVGCARRSLTDRLSHIFHIPFVTATELCVPEKVLFLVSECSSQCLRDAFLLGRELFECFQFVSSARTWCYTLSTMSPDSRAILTANAARTFDNFLFHSCVSSVTGSLEIGSKSSRAYNTDRVADF